MLYDALAGDEAPSQQARLYVWMYEPANVAELELVWNTFGHASWVETIPSTYLHKEMPTREYLQTRINEIRILLHDMSEYSYAQRKMSALILH